MNLPAFQYLECAKHYLPKLKTALVCVEKVLWRHENETLNSIGGIVLHVGQHIQRHIIRYSNSGKVEGGIENYFPDEVTTFSSDLIQFITERFNSWREVMTEYLEGNNDEKISICLIFIEHTGYHLGQIIEICIRIVKL